MMKQGLDGVPTWQEYLVKKLPSGSKIGVDPSLITAEDVKGLKKELQKKGSEVVALTENLIDQIWDAEGGRPPKPSEPIFMLPDKAAGKSYAEKVKEVREELKKKKQEGSDEEGSIIGFVANMLDEVAWLFNLRGSDVPYNPVFFSFALVLPDKTFLYIDEKQLDASAKQALGSYKDVQVRPYASFYEDLAQHGGALPGGKKILIGKRASLAIQQALGGEAKAQIDRSVVVDAKSIKNPTELEGFRESHIRDGAALAQYFAWLEEALGKGEKVTESQGADQLEAFRSKLDGFKGLSFTTISSTGPNGAIIHYSPNPDTCPAIDPAEIYLCDSGAHFDCPGTTDVTRTLHFGKPSDEQKRAFTRVLQGHIAIDQAVFPSGTTGYVIDSLARRPLWQDGLDYRHGTGHGVGSWLNVHEGELLSFHFFTYLGAELDGCVVQARKESELVSSLMTRRLRRAWSLATSRDTTRMAAGVSVSRTSSRECPSSSSHRTRVVADHMLSLMIPASEKPTHLIDSAEKTTYAWST